MYILFFLLFGLIVGLIARAIMPGKQDMGLFVTSLIGMGGSLVGGIAGNLLFGGRWDEPIAAGWIGSVIGALLVLALVGRTSRAVHA